jgi:hypothetical protein
VVEALPDDLVKDIESIGYAKGHWPPDEHQRWSPGYLIFAKRKLILSDQARQQINETFLRVDGGHPRIGWLPLTISPIDEFDPEAMDDDENDELSIEPAGWGSGSGLRN